MILVTGATGALGRMLLDRLLAAGAPVRAASRTPDTADLPDVEKVRVDIHDPGTVAGAVAGVERLFLLSSGPELALHDAHYARAAAAAGVDHIVKLSSARTADPDAHDPIPSWHRDGERAVRDSGVPWTILGPMGFMSNALHWLESIRARDTVETAYGHGRVAVIDPRDIADVAATVLTSDGHTGRSYVLSGPAALNPNEQTAILADVLGRPLRFIDVSPETARGTLLERGVGTEQTDAIMALRASALESFTATTYPTVEEITGQAPRTFRRWAQDCFPTAAAHRWAE